MMGRQILQRQQPEFRKRSEYTIKNIKLKLENMIPKHIGLLFIDSMVLSKSLYKLEVIE